ncbi:MAG: pseudaminic acid synthase [Candidatus Pacebacteria bacterium RIFCSPHIGHO2_01_FULL_46_16]|nr:MAG: pseudaminic acid synthase [Candidatus Pacebacteria bacterium RIFCSPHIGHO2_01_FULL_46_16]
MNYQNKNIKVDHNAFIAALNQRVVIIAEISCNHLQNYDLAVKSIEAIAKSGADAVKMQLFTPDTITIKADNEHFQIKSDTIWDGMTLYDLYKDAYTPWEWLPKLQKIAHKLGLFFFASAFDPTAVVFLEKMHVPAHKVASFEIHDLPLIKQMAQTKKPILISTGIAEKKDIAAAIETCYKAGNREVVVLKCTSEYPTPLEDVNLAVLPKMAKEFGVKTGLSDHTTGLTVPVAAVALGACVIEKHFILDTTMKSFDKQFSLDGSAFSILVKNIRDTEKFLGSPTYDLTAKQMKSRRLGRSLFVVNTIKKGELFTDENVRSIRPAAGLPPIEISQILNRHSAQDIEKGTPLSWSLVADLSLKN